jgi:hypothetical protein
MWWKILVVLGIGFIAVEIASPNLRNATSDSFDQVTMSQSDKVLKQCINRLVEGGSEPREAEAGCRLALPKLLARGDGR